MSFNGRSGSDSDSDDENEDYPEIEQARRMDEDRRGYQPKGLDPTPKQMQLMEDQKMVQVKLIEDIEEGLVPAEQINHLLELVGLEPVCQVCKRSEPPLIQACSPECYNGDYHYECLAQHLIDNFDPPCEYCGEQFHDPFHRMLRTYRTPGPLFMRARFLRDAFFRWHTFDYGLGGTLLLELFMFVLLVDSMSRHDHANWIVTFNWAAVILFLLLLGHSYNRYQDQFPHKFLRFRDLEGHPDADAEGRLTVNITDAQSRHNRGLN